LVFHRFIGDISEFTVCGVFEHNVFWADFEAKINSWSWS
jgi:hypothetical protein